MFLRRLILALLLALPFTAAAQVNDALEQWVEENGDENAAANLSDMLQQLADDPVNLNDSVAVAAMPLLSPFQKKALHHYILLYGPLLSLKELPLVPGFDSTTVALISPLVHVEPVAERQAWWRARGRHTLVTGIGGTVEQAQGYRDSTYEGDNLRALFCYTYRQSSHLLFRLCADKDPGEAWGKDNHYNYHLVLNDLGRLEVLVAGRYNLQFGQGVTLWTGFAPFQITGRSPARFGTGVRAAGAFGEEGFQEGLAATVRLGCGMRLSAFGSRREGEWLAGGHWEYRTGNLVLGVTAVAVALDDSLPVRDYTYNQLAFRGDRQAHLGADIAWQHGHWLLYGEAALGDNGAPAAVGGISLSVDARNRLGLSGRYFHPEYGNLYAQPHSIGGASNERGLALDATLGLPWSINAMLSADLHVAPALRYGCYAPSSGAWTRLPLERNLGSHTNVSLGYSFRRKQRNIPNIDSTLYLGEQTVRKQLQCRLQTETACWRFTSRLILTQFSPEHNETQTGLLLAEEVRYHKGPWRVSVQGAWFNVDDYYSRIYLSESSLQYSYSLPALYGKGLRLSLLAQYTASRHLTLSARYTLSYYPDETTLGTGSATIDANHRQTYHLQLNLKF